MRVSLLICTIAFALVARTSIVSGDSGKFVQNDNTKTTPVPAVIIATGAPVNVIKQSTFAPASQAPKLATTSGPKNGGTTNNITPTKPASGPASGPAKNEADKQMAPKGTPAPSNSNGQNSVAQSNQQQSTLKPMSPAGTTPKPIVTPAQRVEQYFEPVCAQLDKLQPKQLFKVQSQLKVFVEKTAGKMSLCFMQSYSIDPNLAPVTKTQLENICASKKLKPIDKGSFKNFLDCAANNYDPTLDAELERINKIRTNAGTNHFQGPNNDTKVDANNDDDELTLISEVVNKVLSDSKSPPTKADLKVINLELPSGEAQPKTTNAPATNPSQSAITTAQPSSKLATTTSNPSLASKIITTKLPSTDIQLNKTMLNDPNTLILFVDDSGPNATTAAPKSGSSKTTTSTPSKQTATSTSIPSKQGASTNAPSASLSSTAKPDGGQQKTTTITPTNKAPTTGGPVSTTLKPDGLGSKIVAAATTSAPSDSQKKTTTVAPNSFLPAKGDAIVIEIVTTKAPNAVSTSKPSAAGADKTTVGPKSNSGTTKKPLETMEEVLKRQEKEKADLEKKLKEERDRVAKQLKEKNETGEAQKAIKSLQMQRAQAHGGQADIRMHQIEHERQMAIDPIGHTIKHQQYELKQNAAAAANPSTTTSRPVAGKKV